MLSHGMLTIILTVNNERGKSRNKIFNWKLDEKSSKLFFVKMTLLI